MKMVKIVRIETHPEHGSFGVVSIDGEAFSVSLEPYSRDNEKNVSCIPTGQYICKRYSSARYPNTFEVTGVQGRSYILFHTGNTDDDTEGCILLGSGFGILYGGSRGVLDSTRTFINFMDVMEGEEEFKLTIVEEF